MNAFARAARVPAAAALLAATFALAALASSAPTAPTTPAPQPQLQDFIAEPGSSQKFQPFMLHADLWVGLDQRAKLDPVPSALV